MLAKDGQVGKTYRIHHTSGWVDVQVLEAVIPRSGRLRVHYRCLNHKTSREITVKSAAKFKREVGPLGVPLALPVADEAPLQQRVHEAMQADGREAFEEEPTCPRCKLDPSRCDCEDSNDAGHYDNISYVPFGRQEEEL